MGVHGLWELLAPVGRRVSVETLAGKRLAIDASIWMVQFMKAMRDERGEMVRNAHLLGFFRRICKLLFLRTKPVFVFDGGTPALKRRTVVARRRQRENAQAKIRKTAEKLLLNHLKTLRLKELAEDIERQKQMSDAKASIAAEEERRFSKIASTSQTMISSDEDNEDEEMILPDMIENFDPAVLEVLPPELRVQMGERLEGADSQHHLEAEEEELSGQNDRVNRDQNHLNSTRLDQGKLDEMLAASIMAEEGEIAYTASTSAPQIFSEEEDNDTDEEMIVPEVHGNVDRDVLNSLPLSVRLDLLAQMKERQMAENRQKYQKVKKAPEKFSELQIQSYLKAVALRREIKQVQKAAVGNGVSGVQTSRIASEANREFIFSSSFTGNKEMLTSAEAQGNKSREHQTRMDNPSSVSDSGVSSNNKSNAVKDSVPNKSRISFKDGVETFFDERGRIRVSRVRAMGIRMTRDLQRNLDMMREVEQDQTHINTHSSSTLNTESGVASNVGIARSDLLADTSRNDVIRTADLNESCEQSMLADGSSMQISFEDDGESKTLDGDDQLFIRLVAGDSATLSSPEKITSRTQSSDASSDFECHRQKGESFSCDDRVEMEPLEKGKISDESEVEWEEGFSDISKDAATCPVESRNPVSRGSLEEDADLQEAIRRSLVDQRSNEAPQMDHESETDGEKSHEDTMLCDLENRTVKQTFSTGYAFKESEREKTSVVGSINPGSPDAACSLQVVDSLEKGEFSNSGNLDKWGMPIKGVDETFQGSRVAPLGQEKPQGELTSLEIGRNLSEGEPLDISGPSCVLSAPKDGHSRELCVDDEICAEMSGGGIIKDEKINTEAVEASLCAEETKLSSDALLSLRRESTCDVVEVHSNHDDKSSGQLPNVERFAFENNENVQLEFAKADLEEEMRKLGQESMKLGDMQKKLERNAESVSSEMFAECQELLQMFGLPYIIAPMEAEAQCAYMELTNIVDGVVTDDSDVFLFGARSVYKNIFDDRKYVETYFMKDIEKELGLSRDKLICMALLLGSDYTEGVSGIGIVNAIEVVNAFPEADGLQKFREWVESPDPTILGKVDVPEGSTVGRRGSKTSNNGINGPEGAQSGPPSSEQNMSPSYEQRNSIDKIQEMKQQFMEKHRKVSKNWHIPPTFPSEAVISAYSTPQVDKSTEPFSWGKPDHFLLRKLCWEKFAWATQKADELLVPVLNEYNKHETQLRLEAFYSFNERFAKIRSKRIKKAVKEITASQSLDLMGDDAQVTNGSGKKKRGCSGDVSDEKPTGNPGYRSTKSKSLQSKKRRIHGKPILSEMNLDVSKLVESSGGANKQPLQTGRGRGRGRGEMRRGRKATPDKSEHSSSDGDSGDVVHEVQLEECKGQQEVRRSARSRKQVNYSVENLEDNASAHCSDKDSEKEVSEYNSPCAQTARGDAAISELESELAPGNTCLEGSKETDYLHMGGGFCEDDADTGEPQQRPDSPPEDISEEHLTMGGGFCTDERKTSKDPGSAHEIATEPLGEGNEDSFGYIEPADEAELESSVTESILLRKMTSGVPRDMGAKDVASMQDDGADMVKATNDGRAPGDLQEEDNAAHDSGIASYGSLSAMPSLRRKRRRS
ncbi:DNA repair protein UVH3 isoform X2 [Syzygium oleosum]|uniref:DNA repair protein UVH3 isoform X2 n=1 Tax=Syzygium oleosum TaxID=219896 RepID=UPI0024B8F695|nr:DNA repair protein UVH3 isoform X2 [Syzygium oleosum]